MSSERLFFSFSARRDESLTGGRLPTNAVLLEKIRKHDNPDTLF